MSSPSDATASLQSSRRWLVRLGWAAAGLLAVGYLACFGTLHSFPLQDYPNHLARALIIADLAFHHGAQFGQAYAFAPQVVPYLLHDLLLASAVEAFGQQLGSALFLGVVFLSLPVALLYYMRVTRVVPAAAPLVVLLSLYLASDWFFMMAFLGFRLAIALMVVNFALAQELRESWRTGRFIAYIIVLAVGYLMHLVEPVFLAAMLGSTALVRLAMGRTHLEREIRLALPVLVLLGAHFLLIAPHSSYAPAPYAYHWGTFHQKLTRLLFEFGRYGHRPAVALIGLFFACLIWPVRHALRGSLRKVAVLEMLAVAVAFLGVYLVLPQEYADSAFVDVRALAVVALALLIACLNMPDAEERGRTFATFPVLTLACALAALNLAYLAVNLRKDDRVMDGYRAVAASIPLGSHVLPINTSPKEGTLFPFLHAGSFLVIDRHAVIPYLFSGDRGDPMKYFRYLHRPYMPDEHWYRDQLEWNEATEQTYVVEGRPYTWRFEFVRRDKLWEPADITPVDWNRIACGYDFLMIARPVDMRMIGVATLPVRENEAASLVSIDKRACHPERIVTRPVHLLSEH